MKKARITWRKEPSEKGLMAIGQGPRGAILKHEGEDIAHVYPFRVRFAVYEGWYWTAHDRAGRVPLFNSHRFPVETLEKAKADCEAYVRKHLETRA